jgi:Flp pilus assembly pilin Flp
MVSDWALRVYFTLRNIAATFESSIQDEQGQTLAEYGLIMAVIAVAVVVAAGVAFRGAIIGAFSSATDCLNKASSTAGC